MLIFHFLPFPFKKLILRLFTKTGEMLKSKIFINIIRLLIILLTYGYIFWKLYNYERLSEIFTPFDNFSIHSFFLLLILFILMGINWGIESLKWKFLMKKIEQISFIQSLKGILAGITVSIFMINRIGEFSGRVFVLKKENRVAAVSSTFLGNISQFLVTIIAGGVAVSIWLKHQGAQSQDMVIKQYASFFIFMVSAAILWVIFDLQRIKRYLMQLKFFKKYENLLKTIDSYNTGELFILLGASAARYLVFSIQFWISLKFFEVNINLFNAQVAIALTFLVMSAIPTAGAAEIGVRGSVALFFVGMFSTQTAGIVSASVFLWIINLAIPALIGSYYVMKLKV